MNINSLFYSLGLSGLFSSRIFLPAFVTAVFLKYGHSWPFLNNIEFLAELANKAANHPTWFTSGGMVLTLGLLSIVELIADKSPEARELMDEFSVYAKTGLSGLTTLGIMNTADAEFAENVLQQAGILELFPAVLSAAATYFGATFRSGILGVLSEADPDDAISLRSFISWGEEFLVIVGVRYLFYAPLVAWIFVLGFFGVLYLIRLRNESKLEKAKIACESCGEKIHSFATACHHCKAEREAPNIIGFLGGIKQEKAGSKKEQQLRLLRLRRSPLSGERFEGKGVELNCEVDGEKAFSDPALTRSYVESVAEKLPRVLIVSAVLGIVPVLGLIAGVIYYRLRLVAPFRRYLTIGQSFVTKWLLRVLLIALAILQVSFGGIVAVPLMALLNFLFYRSAFKKALRKAGLESG
jgi:hypothetical protein